MRTPTSRRTLRHKFKPGETVIHPNGTQQIVTEQNQKELKTMGYYFLPQVKIGDAVLYQNKLWRIRSIQDGQYTLVTLLDKLEPFKGFGKSNSTSKSKPKSKSFNSMLSKFKSNSKIEPKATNEEPKTANAVANEPVEIVTVDARETRKMEI